MNRIYRVIWNSSLLTWVAVSELAKSNKRSKSVNAINILSLSLIIFTVEGHSATVVPTTGSGCANGSTGTIVEKPIQRAPNSPVTDGSGAFSLVVGCGASGGGFGSVTAIGTAATTTGNAALAVGTNSQASDNSVALGSDAWAVGSRSIALGIGADTSAAGSDSIAFGYQSNTTGSKSIAIGSSANATVANSIALGADTTTTAATGASFLTNNAASTVTGVVSVGSASQTRRIQNVADGSAASDAVTVAQLNKSYDDTNGRLAAALGTGSGAAYNATTDTYTAPINIGGTGKSTIDDAIKATQRSVVAGSNIVVTPTTAADGSISYSVSTSTTPIFNSVTVNNAPTAGTDATNKTYVDAKAAAAKTEVLGGTNVTNVVKTTGTNGQDIYTVNANGTTASAGSSAVTVTAGSKDVNNITDYKVDLAASTKTDIQKGVDAKTAIDNTGLTFKGDTAATSTIKKLGDTVSVTGDTNISTVATTDGVQVKLNPNLDLGTTGSVTTGNSKLDNSGLTITGGPSVTSSGINAANTNISNVADATTDDQAVNKGQLDAATTESSGKTDALGNSTATNLGGGSTYDSSTGTVSTPSYVTTKTDGTTTTANNVGDALNNLNNEVVKPITFTGNSGTVDRKLGETLNITGGLTGAGSNSNIKTVVTGNTLDIQLADAPVFAGKVTANGLDANGNKVENVADATAATDAVNKGQLDSLSTGLTNTGFGLKAADGNTVNKKLGEAVEVVGADSNITTKVTNGQVAIELNKNLNNLTGITVNDGTNGTNGSTVIGKDGLSVKDGSGNTIVGLDNTALTIKDGSGNTETSINKAINTLNASQGETDKFAVKYDKNANGSANYDSVTLAGTGGTTITNVKAGAINATSTDAINGSQLYGVADSVKNVIGGSTTIDSTTGAIIANNIGGTGFNTLDGAISSIKDSTTKAKTTVTAGENVVVTSSTNADGSDNYEVSTAKDLIVDSVKAGDTVLNNAGITIGNNTVVLNNAGLTINGGPSVTVAGIDAGNKTIQNVANAVNATDAVNKGQLDSAISNVNTNVNELANNVIKYDDASKDKITLGGGANGTTITNVKDGTVAQGSKDAVNGGQLWNVQQQVDQNTTDISNIKNDINNGTVGLVQQAGKDATVTVAKDTGGTSVSVAGTDGNRVVTGVKEGAVNATSKDAVNGSQLNTTNQAVVNYLGGGAGYDNITGSFTAPSYTVGDSKYNNVGGAIDALNQADQALNSKIDNVSNKLDNAFRITNNRIDDVEKKANAGIAAAMALESAPYIPGKYTYAAGAAYHGGENAVGVTLRKTADNGRWSITGGVAAASQGDPSVRIGISGVID